MTFLSWGKKSSKIKSFSGEDENHSVQTQGMKKRNHEIFGVFQNLEKKFSKYISREKKKNFEVKYILRISSPDFGKPQKFHDFVFHPPEF